MYLLVCPENATSATVFPFGDSATSLAANAIGLLKYIVAGVRCALVNQTPLPASTISDSRATSHHARRFAAGEPADPVPAPDWAPACAIHCNWDLTSCADCRRSSGSLARQVLMM